MAFQLLSKNCALRHNCALRKRQAAVPSPFPLGGEEKYHAAFFTSATIFFAASPRSLAATIGRPELARISLPCWTFVPSRRTTSGTERSEERRVGTECVSTCRSRWSAAH